MEVREKVAQSNKIIELLVELELEEYTSEVIALARGESSLSNLLLLIRSFYRIGHLRGHIEALEHSNRQLIKGDMENENYKITGEGKAGF